MNELAIFIQSGTRQALHHACSVAVTALSYGEKTTVVLFNEGLAAWVDTFEKKTVGCGAGPWANSMDVGLRRMNAPAVPDMAAECREIGRDNFSILACSGSLEILGLDSSGLIDDGVVDDVVGLPTIWRRTQGARVITV